MDQSQVLQKHPQSVISKSSSQVSQDGTTILDDTIDLPTSDAPFDILMDRHSLIDATILHSATTVLNDLVRTKQPLHTLARKFIPRLASTTEWLLAENAILKLELK
jgi:hypothetical protein